MRAPPTRHAACTKSGKGLVGERISVFWEDEAAWYSGSIREYTEATETHLVVYDDGDQRHEELSDPALQWKLLASSAPSPPAQKAASSAARRTAGGTAAPPQRRQPRPSGASSKQQRAATVAQGPQTAASPADELVVIDGARSASDGALPAAACTKSGKGLVGERISVFWAAEATWYSGVIRDYAETTEAHLVVYDDGDQRHEELSDPALQAAAVQA
jgi:hypothetical protein